MLESIEDKLRWRADEWEAWRRAELLAVVIVSRVASPDAEQSPPCS